MPDFSKIWATNSPLPAYTFSDADYLMGWDFVAAAPPTKNQFDAWFKATDEKLKYLYDQLQNTASKLYPVGSVYISFNSTSPSSLFGGTWQRIKDTFLLANGDSYAANTTGGSATKTISVSNMPAHNHTVNSSGAHTHNGTTSTTGNHTHDKGSFNITGQFSTRKTDGTINNSIVLDGGTSGAFYNSGEYNNPSQSLKTDYTRWVSITKFEAKRSWTGETGISGNHSHTVNLSGGNHTHTTNNTGGGLPLNIMPPYQTVYMWRRTA